MTGPYAQVAGDYFSAGWPGVLPLPPRKKAHPPKGYTGGEAGDPSFPDVMAWIEGPEGEGNVALRMPANVVGLDVDDYGTKAGGETLASGERAYGPLPDTWRTTSRDDGVSGIRLYRIPTGLRWPGTFGPGTEIVRRGHRYAVVPPSIHPEGRRYRWIRPDGTTSVPGPRPDDLPELPTRWLAGLTGGELERDARKASLGSDEAERWLDAHDRRRTCPGMAEAGRALIDRLEIDSAHETLSGVVGLLRLAEAGHRGLGQTLDRVRAAFVGEVTRVGRSSRRSDTDAEQEWARSLVGAVAVVVGDPGEQLDADPCEPAVLNRGAVEALVRRGTDHSEEWVLGQYRNAILDLAHSTGAEVRDRAAVAGFLGTQVVALDLLYPDTVEREVAEALEGSGDRELVDPGVHAALEQGRARAVASPWRLFDEGLDATEPSRESGLQAGDPGPGPQVDEESSGPTPEERLELKVQAALAEERVKRDARRRLAAEDVAPLRLLGLRDFLNAPRPEPVVPGVFYADSLSRIYGAPGCGKSFVMLDLACHVALGRDWRDEPVTQGPVVYVMAEGQAVNVVRTEAWCERNRVDPTDLEGHFFAVPDAVALTDEGVRDLVAAVGELRPALIVLDTKNAMMVGEENSATDTATMRRALDALRKASGACVVLVDHTGHEGTRARGSSAATAAMDTELRVTKGEGSPAPILVEVTRDKAAEVGASWRWHLRMAGEAAALVPTELEDEDRVDGDLEWTRTTATIPTELLHFEGAGERAMPDLARYMASEASAKEGDPNEIGASRTDAERALKTRGHARNTVRRAWSALIELGHIEPASGVKAATGRHVWHP